MNLNKLTKILVIVASLLAVVFWTTIAFSSEEEGGMITPMIYVAFVVLAVASVLVLLYTFKNLAAKKGELKRTFISIGAFLGVILVAFLLADSTPVKVGGEEFSSTISKLVSTGLNTFYIVAIVAIGLMFFTGYNRIKK
jgi:membrane protease YdiL (CAAX protease family)